MLINGQTHLVLESDFPNKRFSQIENIDQKVNEVSTKAVVKDFKNLVYISRDEKTIKEYIMKYGGVSISTMAGDKQWTDYKGGIYRSNSSESGHAVVIIGWDDNYSRNNFYYEKPQNNGAWLVLNSWGTDWGNNGFGWISYEDYNTNLQNTQFIGSVTLASGEVIETETMKEDREKQKEHDKQVDEVFRKQAGLDKDDVQDTKQNPKKQNIFIIVFAVAVILLIIGIILKSKKHK